MRIFRPLFTFFILLSMAVSIYGQKVSERAPEKPSGSEMKIRVQDASNIVEIYPNPATEYLNINLKDSELQNVSFELYDIIGNKVNVQTQEVSEDAYRISVEKLHMGYYVLIISDPYVRYKKAFKFSKR